MNMREYIGLLSDLESQAEDEDMDLTKIQVVGFLLGPGTMMEPERPFIDGSTLHLDYKEKVG